MCLSEGVGVLGSIPARGNIDTLEIATAEWVDWYNHRRIHQYAYDLTPVESERHHYDRAQQPAEQSNQ